MSATILEAMGETIRVEVSVNGSKSPGVKVLHRDGGGVLVAESVPILDVKKRGEWLARLEVEHGCKLADELRPMMLEFASQVIDVLAQNGSPKELEQATPEPEPWPDPVDGLTLASDIETAIRRFVVMQRPEHYTAATLWALFAHAHDAFQFSPIIISSSPEKASGKTRLLEVLRDIVPRGWLISNPSDAVVYHKIDTEGVTFFLDEGDNITWKERTGLLSIYNAGYQRRTAWVPRMHGEGSDMKPRDFSTWGPKGMSCLKVPLPDTTVSRCIIIPFKKKTDAEPAEKLRERTSLAVLGPLKRQAARWAADNLEALRVAEPDCPEELQDRTQDAWEPIFAVADLIGGDWSARARTAALHFAGTATGTESRGTELLADIRRIFAERVEDYLQTKDLIEALTSGDDSPWVEYFNGKALSPKGLARLLHPYGIKSRSHRVGRLVDPIRAYVKADFEDAWARYLPSVTAPVTDGVTGSDTCNSLENMACDGVTGKSTPAGGEVFI